MAFRRSSATRPSADQLAAAQGSLVPDLIGPDLRVLFCGINPSLYSAVVGYHFARPGNRFWRTLHAAGFTERLLLPSQQAELLAQGIGLTNVVAEASASADELSTEDYQRGRLLLLRKLKRFRPRAIAFLGLGAYRLVAAQPRAYSGPQPEPFGGVATWALPNPSGLNAHYSLDALAEAYRALAQALA